MSEKSRFLDWLESGEEHDWACAEAREWVEEHDKSTVFEILTSLHRADWLIWLLIQLDLKSRLFDYQEFIDFCETVVKLENRNFIWSYYDIGTHHLFDETNEWILESTPELILHITPLLEEIVEVLGLTNE
jgi:hypothetical protein